MDVRENRGLHNIECGLILLLCWFIDVIDMHWVEELDQNE